MSFAPPTNHRQILKLAIPMIIANISTPLLGLVDTAVMGHLDSPKYLAGIALGSMIFGFIYWGFSFLRMGTTGITAQAHGHDNTVEIKAILGRAFMVAMVVTAGLLLLQHPIRNLSFWLISAGNEIERLAGHYYDIRIWSAPAALGQYVLLGWFLGTQDVKSPLFIVLVTNLVNMMLDLYFVVYLHMTVDGIALATLLAEYTGLILGLLLLGFKIRRFRGQCTLRKIFSCQQIKILLTINHNLFLRTLCLIFAFSFFTAQGARYGEVILAANAVLMNFQMFMAFALDGFAHALEALVGRAIGAQDKKLFRQSIYTAALWSYTIATGFSLIFLTLGAEIIDALTSLQEVRTTAYTYLAWTVITPLLSFACYLLDGIFIGATWSRQMRNTMLFSVFVCYLPAWYFSQSIENHGLWFSLNFFMLARTLSMLWVFKHQKLTVITD